MDPICTNLHQIFLTFLQLDLCIGYTQEANSGNAELGVKISCAALPQVA
jgi:hypothetical protein